MVEESPEIFRGHFGECIKHLGASIVLQTPKGSRGAAEARKPLADFCGVTIASVARWFHSSGTLPVGEPCIRMMCYLNMVGYRVIELERMPRVLRNFAELVGFGLLSSEDAAELLGYSTTSTLYQVLHGQQGTSEDKDRKMWDAWKARKEELVLKKEKAKKLHYLCIPSKIRSKAEEHKPAMLPSRQTAVVNIMEGLLSLLEEGSLSESSFADLQQSADTILRLSAHLSALSSRLIMSEQRKGGS